MVVFFRAFVRRRSALREGRRAAFTRRLKAWAGIRRDRRWSLRPLAGAATCLLMGQAAWAAPDKFVLPVDLQGTRTIRGKTFSFQPAGQNSKLGPKVEFRDADGKLQSVSMKLVQTSKAGLYSWSSFDIGSSATFEIETPGAGSSSLHRVIGSTKLSEVYGTLKSNGSVYLINPNGVMFGQGAQVNVQGLVASTLNISDQDFLSLTDLDNRTTPVYVWEDLSGEDTPVTFDHPTNYVRVAPGATITTPSGGSVFLMARKVENAGTISTPGGQTALLAGDAVYLKSPDKEAKIYASEVNTSQPVLRGFLFEVRGNEGEASNLGTILTERGNTTLMANTVRQGGTIRATTSVQENGSVFLLARSGTISDDTTRASTTGTLVLTSGSGIEITPDNSVTAGGSVKMTQSRVELQGQTILMEGQVRNAQGQVVTQGASIQAPAANVNVRAETTPSYNAMAAEPTYVSGAAADGARFVMQEGARIDVSGTTDTTVSVARNFVQTELLRNGDLASNPFLKDGELLNKKVVYDVRSAPAVIEAATHQGYKDSIQTTAGERMAQGGQVNIVSTGAVLMQGGSQVDVSGGKVTFTEAVVAPTRLLGADGKAYTLNNARTDVQIVGVSGYQDADATRYGNVYQGQANPTKVEAGYTQGGSGGGLMVHAPSMVLDGQVRANVIQGERQRTGVDARASLATMKLGLGVLSNLVGGLTVRAPGASAPAVDWSNPLTAALPDRSSVSVDWFNASGAGDITVSTQGGLKIEDGANFTLQRGGSLTLSAAGEDGIYLGGDISGAGASVSVTTKSVFGSPPFAGGITLAAGRRIDVAGDLVNQRRDGGQAGTAVAGGKVTISSAAGLDLQAGTAIDVSGGATVSTTGGITGTRAGSISLAANSEAKDQGFKAVELGASLQGHTLAGTTTKAFNDVGDASTGKLTLKVGEVDIVGPDAPALQKGAAIDGFVLGSGFFNQGGFSQFDIDGVRRLTVDGSARIKPQVAQWLAKSRLLNAATGSKLSANVSTVVQADNLAPKRSLALRSSGQADVGDGHLRLKNGSQIDVGPRGSVTLAGGQKLEVEGSVRAAGGSITTQLTVGSSLTDVDLRNQGTYRFGAEALLDVSGTTVLSATNTGGQRFGTVLDGGSIQILAPTSLIATTPVVFERVQDAGGQVIKQATLLANGTQDVIDVRTQNSQGQVRVQRTTVASNGGSIAINVGAQGAALAGSYQAKAGGAGAQGGALSVSITDGGSAQNPIAALEVQQALAPQAVQAGKVVVSADMVQAGGFAHLKLKSNDEIATVGNVNLSVQGDMTLDSPVLAARGNSQAVLAAAGRLARTNTDQVIGAQRVATGGQGGVTLRGAVVDLSGLQVTQGIDQLTLQARDEIRFHAISQSRNTGSLNTGATQVTLDADQVNVATATDFSVQLSGVATDGNRLTITGGNRAAPLPLSAGGSLTLAADHITVDGVVRAPFGQITLKSKDITLTENADLSVSGAGLSVPYGTTTEAGTNWQLNGVAITAPPAKTVTFDAEGGELSVESGAKVDLSAGGNLLAWEFVPGPGGSSDIFHGTYESGTFAVVPSVKGLGGVDAGLLAGSGLNSSVLETSATRTITFGEGGPVPAGTYTVLPARYALLAGGYLVRRTSTTTPLNFGDALTLATGAVRVGATMGSTGGALSSTPATFEVINREQALRFSEIKTTTFDDLVNAKAARQGVAPARRAVDAGTLNIAAQKINLEGDLAFDRLAGGRGGELNISSSKVQVGGTLSEAQVAAKDTLLLNVAQLNRTGVDSLLIGGLRSSQAADGSRLIDVKAKEVTLANDASNPLALNDVILAGTSKVTVNAGAALSAPETNQANFVAEDSTAQGNGALVRVSSEAQVQTRRVSTEGALIDRSAGDVSVGAGAVLKGGTVVVEGTRSTALDKASSLQADSLTLGADRVVLGDADVATTPGQAAPLQVGSALLAQLAQVDRLTLRAFGGVELQSGQNLTVQQSLTLDTPELKQTSGATNSVTAGSLSLRNTSGATGSVQGGTATLNLNATGAGGQDGHIHFDDGIVATQGAGQVNLAAAGSVVLSSRREVTTVTLEGDPLNYADATGEIADDGTQFATVKVTNRAVASGLQADATVNVRAQSVTTGRGAVAQIKSGQGVLTVEQAVAPGAANKAGVGAGGQLEIAGASVHQQGLLEVSSGAIKLEASTGDVTFSSGSRTLADGSSWQVDGVTVPIAAGLIQAKAAQGGIDVQAGSLLSASAPSGLAGGEAGDIRLLAPKGEVKVAGDIRLLSDANQRGGALRIDARTAPSLDGLVDRLNASAQAAATQAGQATARANASRAFDLQQRDGQDITLSAGKKLVAQDVRLVADRAADASSGGNVNILGQIDASGSTGGRIAISAAGDLDIGQDSTPDGQARASLDVSAKGAAKSGGDITLASRSGALRLNEQADVRASGGAAGADGSLTLRAGVREDGAADGDQGVGNTRVAAIQSTLTGVGTLTVQGEERTTVDDLSAQVLTDAKARSEAFQQSAAALDTLNKVANGKLGASAVAKVQSAQVLQSEGDLTLSTDWNLTELVKESSGSQFVVKPSALTPMSLSIVSAGNLNIQASLSGGFVNVPLPGTAQASAAANTTLSNAMKVGAADLPLMAGSDITLVAGAELGSADVAATAAGTAADVRIGDPANEPTSAKQVFVRSTTGDLHLVASRDVVLENDRATVYTTGLLASAEQVPGAEGFGRGNASSPKLHASLITRGNGVNTTRQLPFMLGGGSVSLQAGRDLRTQSVGNASFVSDWTFHKSDVNADKSQSWWARYDLFDMGVATFGGGDIIARAGGDVVDMGFVTATSGYKDDAGVVRRFGGGDVEVSADGNIAGLLAKVGGSTGRVDAGLNIEGTASRGAASLFYENTQLQVQAAQDVLVDLITEAGLQSLGQTTVDSAQNSSGLAGLGRNASLNLLSASGSVAINNVMPPNVDSSGHQTASLLPSSTLIAAPGGSINAVYLNQMPQADGATLNVLAGADLKASGVNVWAESPFGEGIYWSPKGGDILGDFSVQDNTGAGDALTPGSFENARREPVRLIAETGDVTLRAEVGDATRIIAGGDVSLLGLLVQQQDGNELSLVQAGRDLNIIGTTRVRGPGDALFVAGRDVNLTAADGIDTNGNRENGALPEGSANLTVMAGVQPGTSDFGVAEQRFFHLLGGAGVADRPADLYAQLLAARGGQAVPGLDSAAAQAFAGQGFAEQLVAARDLVGAQAFEAAVLTYMQGRDAKPDLSTAQALAALANVPQREQAALLGSVLAPAWSQAVAPEVQRSTALDMAKARGGAYALALSEYLRLRTGTKDLGDAQALQAFEQLSTEQRLLFTNQVLKRELTVAGINATQEKTPDAKLDAYQSGFNALATVFPGSQDTSSLLMGASSIKTQQNSQINVFTPHGGMNVGRLTGLADSAAAAKLGIVTTSGGDITGVVRDSVEVNQSRIFVVENGDMLLWASFGNIDAGKGSKTVTGAPAPVVRVVDGRLVVDTTGSFSGSGIAALDPDSKLYLFAPRGEINAGEAGIRAGGAITLDAPTIVGANDIQIAGGGNLAPPPTVGNAATNVGSLGQSATAAGPSQAESRGTSTPKRRLLLDFLGFGSDKDEDSERDDKKK
ncbi:MAG: filamentous hemagglutinin family protein [Gammaproteobacteria bacterium]|nr:filamentous hemagglutinin family protein [Gammaproteobacteria bacterium]